MDNIKVIFAGEEHLKYAQDVVDAIERAAQDKKSGLAKRTVEYISSKIKDGKGVIALAGDKFAGFCYIESWEHNHFVANSGLIVLPEFRGAGLAKAIKKRAFELSVKKFPGAKIFGLTTSPAVMNINYALGYKAVRYNQITTDLNFWKGCISCVHYHTLCDNGFESCFCTGMVCDPEALGEKTEL